MSDQNRDSILRYAKKAKRMIQKDQNLVQTYQQINIPMGLHVKNADTRRREELIRQLLETGVLRTQSVIEALLAVDPHEYLPQDLASLLIQKAYQLPPQDKGQQAYATSLYGLALGLEALGTCAGDSVVDAIACYPYVSVLLAHMVGQHGKVIALHPTENTAKWFNQSVKTFKKQVKSLPIEVYPISLDLQWSDSIPKTYHKEGVNGIWLGAAFPYYPKVLSHYLMQKEGRCVTWLGPKFRVQDLVCMTHHQNKIEEQVITQNQAQISMGEHGWLRHV